ncbi:MAG TPA: hypothetical protein VNQ76_16340 [Planctomicrobium sp.]|nr:hypothetical protein [Planctomicrobium sp.]
MTQKEEEPLLVYLARRLISVIVFGGIFGLAKYGRRMAESDPAALCMLVLVGIAVAGTLQLFLHFTKATPVSPPPPIPPQNDELLSPIRFSCACGATVKAPQARIGKAGTCRRCGMRLVVSPFSSEPDPESLREPVPDRVTVSGGTAVTSPQSQISSPFPEAILSPSQSSASSTFYQQDTAEQLCSICQTVILDEEPNTRCEACGLPFHTECWKENRGCSAYGCTNVDLLKNDSVIRIEFPTTPPPLPNRNPEGDPEVSADRTMAIFWACLLLGGTMVAMFFSLILVGIPCLITGVIAVITLSLQPRDLSPWVLKTMVILSVVGFLGGSLISFHVWRS